MFLFLACSAYISSLVKGISTLTDGLISLALDIKLSGNLVLVAITSFGGPILSDSSLSFN